MDNKKTLIIILAVAIFAYWFGYTQNKQLSSTQPSFSAKSSGSTSQQPSASPKPQIPAMSQSCSSIFNTLKNMQPLSNGMSFSDFGNLLTSYMKECHPNLNATGGIYGGGVDIELGIVPLQGYGFTEGSTSYALGCIYNPYDSAASADTGKQIYRDLIGCQTKTKTRVWDQNNNFGTLGCAASYDFCNFSSDSGNWTPSNKNPYPPFGKPQEFKSTVDRKHGFNCTPNTPSDTQNYNWNCQPF